MFILHICFIDPRFFFGIPDIGIGKGGGGGEGCTAQNDMKRAKCQLNLVEFGHEGQSGGSNANLESSSCVTSSDKAKSGKLYWGTGVCCHAW